MKYLSELKPEQVKKLYYLREYQKSQDKKSTMSGLVREAVDLYLVNYEKEIDKGNCLDIEKQFKLDSLNKEYIRKKMEIAKKKMNPEKLKLIEKAFLLTDK